MNVLISVLCFIAGGAIAFVFRKLTFEKNFIPASDFGRLNESYQEMKTQEALTGQALAGLKEENKALSESKEGNRIELEQLKGQLAERSAECKSLNKELTETKEQWQQIKAGLEQKNNEMLTVSRANAELKAQLNAQEEKLATQKTEMESLGKKFENAFEVLAQKILDNKSKSFSQEQEKNLKEILSPLQKEIQQFKEDIDSKHREETKDRITLREQVRHMSSLNQTLSEQANKLTETLRLQVKQQGDWGESILEAILENSGLQKDLQYKTQHSAKNDEGKTIRPDVVVNYPDGRKIIIDAKVSLVSYYNMCNAQNGDDEKSHLKELIKSLRAHIDGLASKSYGDISQALDFIIMFVPVEPAYIAAMHGDPELWQYAYKKGILLISPANLIATLKLVKDMWRKDAVDKNAQEIADKAGKLYDKLVGFVETFEKVGTQLEKASETWGDARKQLTAGKGNLISQALKMQALKISAKKDLPEALGNEAILNDHFHLNQNGESDIPLYE